MIMLALIPALLLGQIPADGFVQRPDVKLHYRSMGSGKPMVILSGGPGQDVRQMAGIYEGIKDVRRCLLLEQRATGRSIPAKVDATTIKFDFYVQDLEALRRELKLEKVSLLGHSWGAMLALAYAIEYPSRVDELVLVSSGPIAIEYMSLYADMVEHRNRLVNAKGRVDEPQELRELRPIFFDQKKAEAFASRSRQGEVANSVSRFLFPEMFQRKLDLRPGAKKLTCRTLIVQGRQDMAPESVVLEMKSCIPKSELRFVERSGHFPWIEQPAEFFKALRPFLGSG